MNGERLDIVYKLNALSAIEVWDEIFCFFQKLSIPPSTIVDFGEKRISLEKISEIIQNTKRLHFGVEFGNISISYSPVTAWNHEIIVVKDESKPATINWNELVQGFINKAGFVQAWVSDIKYEFWQNAKDPLQYEANGRSYANLPMVSNNLPFPLEQMEIDISKNPGRRIIKSGFVEAIGSPMWIGEEFWNIVGTNKNDVLESYPNESKSISPNVIRLQISERPFEDSDNSEEQIRLRSILYK